MNSSIIFTIKLIHILSGSLFFSVMLLSLFYSYFIKYTAYEEQISKLSQVLAIGHFVIIPLAFLQLVTGFTFMSLAYPMSEHPLIKLSIVLFLVLLILWFALLNVIGKLKTAILEKRNTVKLWLTWKMITYSIVITLLALVFCMVAQ